MLNEYNRTLICFMRFDFLDGDSEGDKYQRSGAGMILEMEEKYFTEVACLIELTVNGCIDAAPSSQALIIEESVRSTADWIKGICKGLHLVYLRNEQILGVILVKEYWNMASLFVLPEFQGRGIGKMLVNAAIEKCRSKSPSGVIRLNSSEFASGFYKSMGFVQTGEPRPLPGGCIPYEYRLAGQC